MMLSMEKSSMNAEIIEDESPRLTAILTKVEEKMEGKEKTLVKAILQTFKTKFSYKIKHMNDSLQELTSVIIS